MLKPFYNKKGHLGMTRQQLKAVLKGAISTSNRELYVGGAADKFTIDDDDLVALNDKVFNTSDEATAYIKNFIEQNVTTVYLNLTGAPDDFGELSFLTVVLQAQTLFNEPMVSRIIYSRQVPGGQTLQGHFKTYEISGKYYTGIVLSYAS